MLNNSTRQILIKVNETFEVDLNLHIKIVASKSNIGIPNSCLITIFNLSPGTYSRFEKKPRIEVYENDELLFIGKVINTNNRYIGTSWEAVIYCNDIKVVASKTPNYLTIPKGTTNEDILKTMASQISDLQIDFSAFQSCAKSKGSLLKQMVVEYKKEADMMKAIQNMFKGCDTEVVKEDGSIKFQDSKSVANFANPKLYDKLLEAPTLSNKDISIKILLDPSVKLGLGFKVKAKSYNQTLVSPYTYENQFKSKIFRTVEFIHETDNFTENVAITTIKGMNLA